MLQQNWQTGTGPVNRTLRIAFGQRVEVISTGSDLHHRKIGLAAAAINLIFWISIISFANGKF
jgi:hypothetical protein